MKTVLAAIDFSPVTDRVILEAIRLARSQRCRLRLVHVIAPPHPVDEFGAAVDVASAMAEAERSADEQFVRIGRELRGKFGHIQAACRKGAPVTQILQSQRECGAMYIVMGSHGRSAVYDMLVGSTTHGVVQGSPCPVVIVPANPVAAPRSIPDGHYGGRAAIAAECGARG